MYRLYKVFYKCIYFSLFTNCFIVYSDISEIYPPSSFLLEPSYPLMGSSPPGLLSNRYLWPTRYPFARVLPCSVGTGDRVKVDREDSLHDSLTFSSSINVKESSKSEPYIHRRQVPYFLRRIEGKSSVHPPKSPEWFNRVSVTGVLGSSIRHGSGRTIGTSTPFLFLFLFLYWLGSILK